jgi:hypothetical protein
MTTSAYSSTESHHLTCQLGHVTSHVCMVRYGTDLSVALLTALLHLQLLKYVFGSHCQTAALTCSPAGLAWQY